MPVNANVQRLATNTPGFPDLRIPDFVVPPMPADIVARFPSADIWQAQLQTAHTEWRGSLQRALEQALQAQKALP